MIFFFPNYHQNLLLCGELLTVCIMFLSLESANELVCYCSLVKYSWHSLSPSCRATKTWQLWATIPACRPYPNPTEKQSTSYLHQRCRDVDFSRKHVAGSCLILWVLEQLRKKIPWCPCGCDLEGVTQVHTIEWVRCGECSRQGRELSLTLVKLVCYKQVILRLSLATCAWESCSQLVVSPVHCPGMLLGIWNSVLPFATRWILTELLFCIVERWLWCWSLEWHCYDSAEPELEQGCS